MGVMVRKLGHQIRGQEVVCMTDDCHVVTLGSSLT